MQRTDPDSLADRIRRGEDLSEEEVINLYTSADHAGVLYYKMLTMVREQRSLAELPATLKEIIKTRAWQKWRWVGSSFGQNSLEAYLTKPPPNGVGIKLDTVVKLIADDIDARTAYDEEMKRPGSRTDLHDNIMEVKATQGTSRAYTLSRLKRERPDLFARVRNKEMSPNAAAIEAGFRKKQTPLAELRAAWRKASSKEREAFRREIDAA